MKLQTAELLTKELLIHLNPFCHRIEVAGSVRRKCPDVNDIDLVIIQHSYKLQQYFLSKDSTEKSVYSQGLDLKSGPKHKQIRYEGEKIELWFADKSNFGLIHIIRTGSASFSQSILSKWKEISDGGYSDGGYLHTRDNKKINTYDEMDVFNLCELSYIDPLNRSFKNFVKL